MSEKVKNPVMLKHDRKDNVAVVVVEGFSGGDGLCVCTEDDSDMVVKVHEEIPIGHKVALLDFAEGDTVVKYGEDIGIVKKGVKSGEHVHVHNMKTKRW